MTAMSGCLWLWFVVVVVLQKQKQQQQSKSNKREALWRESSQLTVGLLHRSTFFLALLSISSFITSHFYHLTLGLHPPIGSTMAGLNWYGMVAM